MPVTRPHSRPCRKVGYENDDGRCWHCECDGDDHVPCGDIFAYSECDGECPCDGKGIPIND